MPRCSRRYAATVAVTVVVSLTVAALVAPAPADGVAVAAAALLHSCCCCGRWLLVLTPGVSNCSAHSALAGKFRLDMWWQLGLAQRGDRKEFNSSLMPACTWVESKGIRCFQGSKYPSHRWRFNPKEILGRQKFVLGILRASFKNETEVSVIARDLERDPQPTASQVWTCSVIARIVLQHGDCIGHQYATCTDHSGSLVQVPEPPLLGQLGS